MSVFRQLVVVMIPAACGGHAETMAAYRFFDNDKTTFEKILQPHCHATEQRIASQEVVLCVQDTTELDLTTATSAKES